MATTTTRIGAPTPVVRQRSGGAGSWVLGGLLVLLVVTLVRCSSSPTAGNSSASMEAGNAQEAIGSAVAAQSPPPVRPLDRAAVRRGVAAVTLASREGLAGEMIYSQNCYDALGRRFAWAKLDACGGFDAEAALALGDAAAPGSDGETAWFQSETAAGRYLKAATAAGEIADAADARLADLQARAAKGRAAKPAPVPTTVPDGAGANVTTPDDDEGGGADNATGER